MAEVGPDLPTTFGKYYLTEKLATGGMAEIYLGKIIGPNGFEKALVIKQIHPKLSGQRHFVDLFVAEAKILVTLAHGNIVPVYELGVIDDTYFIAMDYIDGPTLYRLTETMSRREGRMEPAVAAWITARILDGLDYAHRKGEGVIHRDLSPRNVMMSRDGEVKLVDFGIAVALGEPGESEASQSAPTGSFPYMSPEQVRRESLTPQTDLFTVGVLFWEMLVGARLFARPDADATLAAVLKEQIPKPSEQRPGIPARLDELVMRALERDQDARWPSAGDMLAAINKYLYSLDETPGPRDVAALVAKYCPPETRRLPTHLEAIAQEAQEDDRERSGPLTMPVPDPDAPVNGASPPAGPHTAVIPRDGSQPKGKRPVRHQTFATHVDLKGILERAGTHDGEAEAEAEADDTAPVAIPTTKVTPRLESLPGTVATDERNDPTPLPAPVTHRPKRANTERPDRGETHERVSFDRPPARGLLVVGGLLALALSIGAVYVFYQKRDDVLHYEDARLELRRDAAMMSPDRDAAIDAEPTDAPATPSIDAPPIATSIDAGVARHDAGTRVHDSGAMPARPDAAAHEDAGLVGRPDASTAAATATLSVGANPWGEVFVDGKKMPAHAPFDFHITPGHHEVKVVFPLETPPIEKTCSIDVKDGETARCDADFTH